MDINKGFKIFAGVMVFFGVLSLIFLLTAKKKPQTTPAQKTVQATSQNVPKTSATSQNIPKTPAVVKTPTPKTTLSEADIQKRKDQWQQCKDKTMVAGTTLIWNVQIAEGIPTGGTYAKGLLNNEAAFPVHVIIKSDSTIADKIKNVLVVGKTPNIRGTCKEMATDGSVVLEAF